jgi:hypothetical protein
MKNTLAFAAAATLVLIGTGWYLGWYTVKTTKNVDGTEHVDVDVDSNKVRADVNKGIKKGEKIVHEIEDQSSAPKGSGSASSSSAEPEPLDSINPPKVSLPPRFQLPNPPAVPPVNASQPEIPKFDLPNIPVPVEPNR